MMTLKPPTRPAAVSLLLMLLFAATAGCLAGEDSPSGGDTGDGAAGFASFEDAMAAPGIVLTPAGAESSIHLKLLQPADPANVSEGPQPVVVLLYDSATDAPVTDALLRLEAEMPSMGHGTSGEVDPEHLAFGVYEGRSNFAMPGPWVLNLDARLAGGTLLAFDTEVQVGGSGHEEPGDGMHHDNSTYASFEEAHASHGAVHEPVNASSSVRLKLLHPTHPDNVSVGEHPVTVLLYDHEAEAPIEDAAFTIRTWMPAHGHGTSDEAAPTHDAHGVYHGHTDLAMEGGWVLYLNATLATGDVLAFEVPIKATAGGSGDHDGHEDHDENMTHEDQDSPHGHHA